MSRRFTVSYAGKTSVEGILYADGCVHLNDTWVPADFESIEQLIQTLSRDGRHFVEVTWIDEETEVAKVIE